ncbi:MAG: hypothetical protein KKA60_00130, partial [Proteobacteria bacterium]|nr:hypothetical protein [Pseudomonadota bacterium]
MKAREMMTRRAAGAIVFLGLMVLASGALAGVQAGYSEYYIPGDEDYMMLVLDTIGANDQTTSGMHAVIAIVAGSDNTTVYYDHWEDGYDFNPDNPATADQTVALNNKGDSYTFESTNIPLPRTTSMTACGGGPCYDGRDRIYVAGGATTVTRASWTEQAGTLLAVAWEVYPVRPQLTTYILPFGEDLASGAQNLQDFDRVFALIQATADGTQVQVDLDHNGTYDPLDWTRDGFADGTVVNLDAGEVFLLDRVSALSASLNTGTRIEGNSTLQIQYIIGDQGDNYEIRGLSAFPRGFWDDEYYAPVDGANPALNDPTDIYLHNPNAAAITISYQTTTITGSFDIDPHETVSFGDEVGSYVPVDSAVYMKGTAPFWGISTIDTAGHTTGAEGNTHDWGYSLVPAFMLAQEHYMGWAPGAQPVDTTGADRDDSGIFITSATDNTRVFIDEDNDGAYDFTYTLNRLQTQYVWDTDGDLSEANIWATGPIAIAYGQNPETAPTGAPAIDVGYTTVPGTGLVELVLTVDKQTDPVVLPTTANEDATYTLMVGSYDFEVDNVSVVDTLPAGWSYQTGTAFITLADKTTDTTNPSISGQTLTWGSGILGSMEPNQQITIVFTARNTIGRAAGDLTRNTVDATGHRTVGGVTQDFVTSDFVFNTFGDLIMEKSTLGTDPLSPGDTYSYSITVINPFTAPGDATGIAIYDPVPAGVGYVAGSSAVTSPSRGTTYFNDFESGGQGFTTGADDGTPLMNWELGAPATVSPPTAGKCATNCYGGGPDNDHTNPGTNCWGTDLNDLYSLSINSGIYLYSPIYDFSNDASVQLSYWEWLEIEGNTYDYARLQCNVNGGGWTTVWTFGESAGAARTDSAWSLFVNNATSYAAGKSQVQWRWMISTDGSWQWGGWYIDDVKVQTTTQGPIRVTEYYLGPGTFTGTTYDLTLNQDLAQDYFVIVRGSGGNNSNARAPNVNYAALASDPLGTGDLAVSGANNRIGLTRGNAVDNWVGVVTVVECTSRQATDGFKLLDVQRVAHTNAAVSGTDTTGTAWTDINQVMLMGGFYGAGCDTAETQTSDNKNVAARIWPSGANTINWTRDAGGANSLTTATSTVMAVEWGSEWTVQRVRVQTNNGGNGVDATGEYGTTALTTSVARDHTWVWGTGHTNDNGVGDGPEGVVVTLGDGVNQNATETTVACGIEVNSNAVDFEVYALTHPNIQVDYRFKPDGDSAALTYDQAVDNASGTTSRMALVYNGCNNTNNNYPRPIFSARYLSDTSVRLERRWSGEDFPAWVQGIQFTIPALSGGVVVTAGGDPPGLVSASDGYSLAPGESLTLTYTVTVRDPLPTGLSQILNTAWVSTAEMPLPMSDSAVNQVVNPSSASASVGDYVWLDADGDGVQDAGESGLANVTVTLKDQYGTPLLTTLTNATGRYLFTGVSPGTGYWAEVTAGLPAGLFQSSPSGHSDKRTNPFDLAAGQAYLDADLGFAPAPGTATIGDRVWSDADSDRIQDAGEPGISGVIVELYLDDGDGIPEVGVGGDDTYVTSSVTGPGGLYLFAGVTASGTEDYFALVDVAQASLTGYTYTTGAQVLVLNLDAGDAVLNADFGFNNPSNATIKDRVWLDPDEDGNDDNNSPDFDDNAETGIPGITVELRDASSFVIASTTTAADGTFRFSGVEAGGADYNIRITDTAGVLTDYFATTVPAAARTLAIDNLSADLDFTTEPSEPNFGFNIEGTIGDTVFNDVDGDGTQDAGEPGMGGVAVRLYGDTDGDGILDGGEPLLATVTTNSAGGYLFSGLDDGKYIVSIPTPPAGFDYTSEGGGGDLDPAAGDQQPSTITGGGTDLARDFGYKAQVA